jgi:hypothetical protein
LIYKKPSSFLQKALMEKSKRLRVAIASAGLEEAQLAKVNAEWPVRIPDDYARFLRVTNGVRLFAGALSLHGYLHSLSRSVDGLGQPVDLRYGTIIKEINYSDDTDFGIGCLVGYSRRLHLIIRQGGQIVALNESSETVRTWANFATFWEAELTRLSPFFDRTGRPAVHKDDLLVFDRQ